MFGSGDIAVSTIGPAGGWLHVANDGPEDYDQLVVKFSVPESALSQNETITMRALGHKKREHR